MNSAENAKPGSWDEIEVKDEWMGLPAKKPSRVKKALKGNSALVGACVLAFMVGVLPGYLLAEQSRGVMMPLLEGITKLVSLEDSAFSIAVKIFSNNMQASLLIFFLGFTLFLALLILLLNGFLIGFVLRLFVEEGAPITYFILGTLPHGLFELPAFFLSAALGMRIGLSFFFPEKNRVKETAENIKAGVLTYLLVVTPLLLLAAFMEAYVSAALIR